MRHPRRLPLAVALLAVTLLLWLPPILFFATQEDPSQLLLPMSPSGL